MEDNESQPTNVLDMIATDASPAEITDTLKSMLYAKSGERLEYLKPYAAASVFGGEPPEDWESMGEHIQYDFLYDNQFAELKESEMLQSLSLIHI